MGTDMLCFNFSVRKRSLCLVHNQFLRKGIHFPGSYSVVVFTDPVQGKIPISALLRTAI